MKKRKKSKHKAKKQDHRPILIPPAALDVLLRLPAPHNTNCVCLYIFYLKKCVRDKTNRIWCNDSYVAGKIGEKGERKGLKWDIGRVKRTKAQLVKLGFIKVIQSHDTKGHFAKKYVEVKFYASKMKIEKEQYLSTLDDYAEEFAHWVNHFTTEINRRDVRIAELERQPAVSSNLPPTVKNRVKAYSNKKEKLINNNSHQNRFDDGVRVSSFSEDLKKTFDYKCSKKLENVIRKKRKVFRKIDRNKWALQFKKFRTSSKIKKTRIKKVILWYVNHFGEEFVPKAYSAKTFCDKFLQIEDAMFRIKKDIEEGHAEQKYVIKRNKISK